MHAASWASLRTNIHPTSFPRNSLLCFCSLSLTRRDTAASRSHLCKHWHRLWQEGEAAGPVVDLAGAPKQLAAARIQRRAGSGAAGHGNGVWTGAHQSFAKHLQSVPLLCLCIRLVSVQLHTSTPQVERAAARWKSRMRYCQRAGF